MRNRHIQLVAIAVLIALSASALASPITFNINSAGNSGNTSIALQKIMYTDGVDNRDFMSKNVASTDPEMHVDLTPDEMEIIKKTTGHFVCGSGLATVDIGMELDEVIAPMHALDMARSKKCTFQTFGGEKFKVIISKSVWAAYKKWNAEGRLDAGELVKLKLERPVAGVKHSDLIPYRDESFRLKLSTPLIVVSGYQVDWNKKKRIERTKMHEPLAYRCNPTSKDETYKTVPPYAITYTSNCDGDSGASGSKLYSRDASGKLIKVGMTVTVNERDESNNILPNGEKSSPVGLSLRFLAIDGEMLASYSVQAQPQESKPTASKASTHPSSQLSQRSNFAICSRALNSDQTAFDDRGFYTEEIEEAQRRGFDVEKCRAEIAAKAAQ